MALAAMKKMTDLTENEIIVLKVSLLRPSPKATLNDDATQLKEENRRINNGD